jgi:hypothetical protein
MTKKRDKNMDRRDFFLSAGRALAAGALAVSTIVFAARTLGHRNRQVQPEEQECVNRGLCGNCGRFSRCRLPQALSAKQAQGRR